jgi:hypothetical protein
MKIGKQVISVIQLKRGMLVRWRWGGHGRTIAKDKGVRPVGRVVTRDDYPHMACEIGLACLDDSMWVLDPEILLAKGRVIRIVENA